VVCRVIKQKAVHNKETNMSLGDPTTICAHQPLGH